jgi:hypothetical protein
MPRLQRDRQVTTYAPLRSFIRRRGGLRVAAHGKICDRLIDIGVEEWPQECPPDKIRDVLRARMNIRVRQEYGSIVALIIIGVLVNVISRLIMEWWFKEDSHRVLMAGWNHRATKEKVRRSSG